MFSAFFIRRPVFAMVLSIVIVLLGAVAYLGLPVAQYPELAPPIVRVEAAYPGANAQTIADTVATAIEQEVNGVDRMIYMSSSAADGRYALDVSFEQGTNVDTAAVLVQNRVNIAAPKLPEEVRRLGVTTRKQSTTLAGVIALYSPDATQTDITLSNYVTLNWKDEVLRIPGVGGVTILPSKEYGMRLWLDPEKLKARGLTVGDVASAVREQNVQVAAGSIGRSPAPEGTDFELTVNTKGRLSTPEEFGEIIVKASWDGRVVRVRDVARTELGAKDYSTLATFNGSPNAIMVVYQLPGANLVDISNRLRVTLDKLTGPNGVPLPAGTQAKFFYDSSMFIRASLHEVGVTLIEAFVLVFLVVLVFLQSLRTTLIPMLTIPVSLIGTLLLLKLFGFSINMLTMFGMVLAIGIVVDDAIVVVENVERNMRVGGLGARDATIRAMGEIFGPVVAITLVLMSVFLPTAALPGITGEMYRQFALTIAASTGLSAVCALTLAPALCALILKPHTQSHAVPVLLRPLRWAGETFNRFFDALASGYAGLARVLCRVWPVTLAALAVVLFGTYRLVLSVPTGFVPGEDLGFVVVAATLPDGASLQRTRDVINAITPKIKGVAGVEDVVALTGFSVIQGTGPVYGNCWIVLKPWDERYAQGRTLDVIMNEIRGLVAPIREADTLVFSLPAINGLGNTSGIEGRILDRAGAGREELFNASWRLVGAALGQANKDGQQRILGGYSTFRPAVPQLYLDVDREKVIKMDVPLQTVFDTLQTHLGSSYVNDFNYAGRTFQVNLQADSAFRLMPQDIRKLEVRSRSGAMIPLGTLVNVSESMGPDKVERYNMYVTSPVYGLPAPGTSSGDAMSLYEQAADNALSPGMGFEWTALSYQEKQAGGKAALIFLLGIVLVYLILAAQYESWTAPLSVVLSVPLVVGGAMIALMTRGLDNNIFTQIGLVLLIGLGAKNAILIVEFARENRARGMSILDSAVSAAQTRLRPILMTSLAFILGVVPLTMAIGAGAGSRRALGTAVFGGMTGATVLGLMFTPVLYVVVTSVAEWFKPSTPREHPAPHAEPESSTPATTHAS